tara:strand:- start:184 stop:504 length:321 start_codon:yes stop_codon:yes gene_type:complete
MEKFLCVVSGADDACAYPLRNLRGLAVTADATILMTFNSFRNGTADNDRDTITLTVTADTEKAVMAGIVAKINAHPNGDPFVVIADDVNSVYAHADIVSCTIAYSS